MNHLVYLDARAGELEKILSGVKTMLAKENDPTKPLAHPIFAGDRLYFLRDHEDRSVRVQATVVNVRRFTSLSEDDRSGLLKEMQPRLHFTENQYNFWREKENFFLIEFDSAQKIDPIHISTHRGVDQAEWVAFETVSQIQ